MLAIAEAVASEGKDAGIAAHYGDPFREQRTLAESVGVVDRSNRGVLTVTGEDRLSWLHTLTTQHLEKLPTGKGTEALVLSPHGHIARHLLISELADEGAGTTWIDVEPGANAELLSFLDTMRFMLRVHPKDVTAEWALLSVLGPETPRALAALGAHPTEPYDVVALPDGGWVRRMPWPASDNADVLVPRSGVAAVIDLLADAGVPVCGMEAYEALRVAARRPRLGQETDHRTIVQEPNWLPTAVHLNKGCYPGQETVAKVHNVGQPPRRMALLHLDGSSDELPAHGTPVFRDEREIGFVGTAVRHYEWGNIALALVKRTTPDDAELMVAGSRAAIDTPE